MNNVKAGPLWLGGWVVGWLDGWMVVLITTLCVCFLWFPPPPPLIVRLAPTAGPSSHHGHAVGAFVRIERAH